MNKSFTNTYTVISSSDPGLPSDNRAGYSHTLKTPTVIYNQNGIKITQLGYSYSSPRTIYIQIKVENNTGTAVTFIPSDYTLYYTSDDDGQAGSVVVNESTTDPIEAGGSVTFSVFFVAPQSAMMNSATKVDIAFEIRANDGVTRLSGTKSYFTGTAAGATVSGT